MTDQTTELTEAEADASEEQTPQGTTMTETTPTHILTDQLSPAAAQYLLNFADDEHFIGARHTSWIGMGPFLEEDLAFCSIAQDELGHAISLYEFLTPNVDHFALLRDPKDYRSCDLVELACDDWQDALVRHWMYDRAEELRWGALIGSSNKQIDLIAKRSDREEEFHRAHAASFMSRIARSGEAESIQRIVESVDRLLPYGVGIFEPAESEPAAVAEGFATATSAELASQWCDLIRADLDAWELVVTWPEAEATVGSRSTRIDGFDDFLGSLQEVITIDINTEW